MTDAELESKGLKRYKVPEDAPCRLLEDYWTAGGDIWYPRAYFERHA